MSIDTLTLQGVPHSAAKRTAELVSFHMVGDADLIANLQAKGPLRPEWFARDGSTLKIRAEHVRDVKDALKQFECGPNEMVLQGSDGGAIVFE